MRARAVCAGFALAAAVAAGCGPSADPMRTAVADEVPSPPKPTDKVAPTALVVESDAFKNGAMIPAKYTSDGENISPPLRWSAGPTGTACYALIMDDPAGQSGTWTHWVLWNEPGVLLSEGVKPALQLPDGAAQGRNSWQKLGYGGPQPPKGTHRYFFRVWALDARLDLKPESDRAALEAAMQGHILASGELMGRYEAKTQPAK